MGVSPWTLGSPGFRCITCSILPKPVIYVSPSLGCVCLSLQPGYKLACWWRAAICLHTIGGPGMGWGPQVRWLLTVSLPPTWLSLAESLAYGGPSVQSAN